MRAPVDALDAEFLNAVYLKLSEKIRRCLKLYHFRRKLKMEWVARKIGVRVDKIENAVEVAEKEFAWAVHVYENNIGGLKCR